jgi:predicted kinase
MDFDARSHADLGNVFINAYAEQSGDWDAFGVLPLYLCRHAYVRAMVNSILSEEVAGDDAARRKALHEASLYYKLAWRYTQPRRGWLVLMCGLSGSGKSTVARALAKRTGAVHIRSDAVRKHLAGVPLEERGGAELYTPEMTRRTYERLVALGGILAADGYIVILDAKFDHFAERTAAMNAARQRGLSMCVLHCVAPHDVLRQRLEARAGDVADATADLLDQQESQWEDFTDGERRFVTTLDTTRTAAEVENGAVRASAAGVVPKE